MARLYILSATTMTPREIFLLKLTRGAAPRAATGSATSIVTTDLMQKVGAFFPEAHQVPATMARLAAAGYTELGFDNVMPLFSVWHESAALGCEVNWGDRSRMPDGQACYSSIEAEINIPKDWLQRPSCAVPLQAIRLLKKEYGAEIAVVGKVFGPWTLGYDLFSVEEFLISTLTNPEAVKRVLRTLVEVTVAFAKAQIDAGADAITLADHCTRDLCSPETYSQFLQEIHQELHERIPCPQILHICGDTADRISYIQKTGIECFHFDAKVPAPAARQLAGDRLALMGGTSNINLVRNGNAEAITADLQQKVAAGIDIIGPECAVPLDAPMQNLVWIAREAKRLSAVTQAR